MLILAYVYILLVNAGNWCGFGMTWSSQVTAEESVAYGVRGGARAALHCSASKTLFDTMMNRAAEFREKHLTFNVS
jgi:hypothetical protein